LVVDPNPEDNSINILTYSAERNTDWEYKNVDGKKVLTRCEFIESYGQDAEEDAKIVYEIENGIVISKKYKGDAEVPDSETPIIFMGKPAKTLPIFFCNSMGNGPEIGTIPLLGISDIALTIYRKDADLAHAQYQTCNPTLFIFGIDKDNTPKMIGSSVTVAISNPNGRAEYPATDTSALDHVKNEKMDLFSEAVSVGVQTIGSGKKSAESAEALEQHGSSNVERAGASLGHWWNITRHFL